MQAPIMVVFFNQGGRIVIALLGLVTEIIGGMAIHHDFAANHPHVFCGGKGEKCLDAGDRRGAKTRQAGGAMAQHLLIEKRRHLFGVIVIGEFSLFGKSIFAKPSQQLLAMTGNHITLRIMDMGIDKAPA